MVQTPSLNMLYIIYIYRGSIIFVYLIFLGWDLCDKQNGDTSGFWVAFVGIFDPRVWLEDIKLSVRSCWPRRPFTQTLPVPVPPSKYLQQVNFVCIYIYRLLLQWSLHIVNAD